MKAEFIGQDDTDIGVRITDNNGVEHHIEMQKTDGNIYAHHCDAYADKPEGRTPEENEYSTQARRYAKWHVYRERGHDTLPPTENPDRILAALVAVTALSESKFAEYFADIQTQIQSHYDDSTVELPFDDADPDDVLVYKKDIYLQPNPTEFEPPVLEQFLGRFEGDSESPVVPAKEALGPDTFDSLEFDIEAVSEMHYLHNDGQGNEQTERSPDPLDRDPDATIELMPFDPAEIESFHHYVVSHLAYQIRDYFLLMGVKPPVGFRAQGWGSYHGFRAQRVCPQYEEYWSPSTDIESWEPT